MSDSAPLKQQQNVSRMQAPTTDVHHIAPMPVSDISTQQNQSIPGGSTGEPLRVTVSPTVPVVPIQQSVPSQSQDEQVSVSGPQSQSSAQQPIEPVKPSPPPSVPISATPHKEGGPITLTPPSIESAKPVELVQPSNPEISVPPEVKEVVSVSESAKPIKVDVQLKQAGVALAAESTPVVHTPTGDVKLPMTYADALATEKKTKFLSAVHWFAAFVAFQWRKLDPTLKD